MATLCTLSSIFTKIDIVFLNIHFMCFRETINNMSGVSQFLLLFYFLCQGQGQGQGQGQCQGQEWCQLVQFLLLFYFLCQLYDIVRPQLVHVYHNQRQTTDCSALQSCHLVGIIFWQTSLLNRLSPFHCSSEIGQITHFT